MEGFVKICNTNSDIDRLHFQNIHKVKTTLFLLSKATQMSTGG